MSSLMFQAWRAFYSTKLPGEVYMNIFKAVLVPCISMYTSEPKSQHEWEMGSQDSTPRQGITGSWWLMRIGVRLMWLLCGSRWLHTMRVYSALIELSENRKWMWSLGRGSWEWVYSKRSVFTYETWNKKFKKCNVRSQSLNGITNKWGRAH